MGNLLECLTITEVESLILEKLRSILYTPHFFSKDIYKAHRTCELAMKQTESLVIQEYVKELYPKSAIKRYYELYDRSISDVLDVACNLVSFDNTLCLKENNGNLQFVIWYDDEMNCEPHEGPSAKKVINFNIVAPYQAIYVFAAREDGEYPSMTVKGGSDLYVAILPTEEQKNQLRDDYIRYFLCNS
jgi:hypothetical protein